MATGLLPRQRKFADGIAAGLNGAEAARQAGYSAGRAKATAHRLRQNPMVQAAIERRRNGYVSNPRFDDPLDFLKWAMVDPEFSALKQRVKVAIFLLPYCHVKRGGGASNSPR